MKRGPKPKAREIMQRNGAYRNHPNRENHQQPKTKAKAPKKPKAVVNDDLASKKWTQMIKLLREMGTLADCDTDLLELYCLTYSGYQQAIKLQSTTDIVLFSEDQSIKRNPITSEVHKYADRLNRLIPEFGLSPSSRTRIIANPKQENDPFLDFLHRRESTN